MTRLRRILFLPVAAAGLLAAGCACPHGGPHDGPHGGAHGPPPGRGPHGAGMFRDGPGGPPPAKREGRRPGKPGKAGPMAVRGKHRPAPPHAPLPHGAGPREPGPDREAEIHLALRRAMERIERIEAALKEGHGRAAPGGDREREELRQVLEKKEARIRELEIHARRLEDALRQMKEGMREKRPEGPGFEKGPREKELEREREK